MKGVLFIYSSYSVYEGRIILFTEATLYMAAVLFTEVTLYVRAVLFIYWSYNAYEDRIIYLLKPQRIWGPYNLFTEDILYM